MKTHVAWLSAEQAAVHLGFVDPLTGHPQMRAFYAWKAGAKPRQHRIGKRLRFRQVDLDRFVEPESEVETAPLKLVGGRG